MFLAIELAAIGGAVYNAVKDRMPVKSIIDGRREGNWPAINRSGNPVGDTAGGVKKFTNLKPLDVPNMVPIYELIFRNGKWMTKSLSGVYRSATGKYNYVVQNSRIYVSNKPYVGHIDIARGKNVEYAGTIQFKGRHSRGSLVYWDNWSGHYQPGSEYSHQAGLPIDSFKPVEF